MHSHLDIKINKQSLALPDDFELSVDEKNPMFNDVTFFSYPAQIPVEGNLKVLKNIANRDSDMTVMDLEHAASEIYADGLPLNHGQVITQDNSEINGTFDFNIDAQQQSFEELIGDMNCQDVDISGKDIIIGEQLGTIDYEIEYTAREHEVQTRNDDGTVILDETRETQDTATGTIEVPLPLGFSYPARTQGFPLADKDTSVTSDVEEGVTTAGQTNAWAGTFSHGRTTNNSADASEDRYNPVITESFINVSKPYPFPYCNARVAYAHRGKKTNEDKTEETDGYVKGNTKGPMLEDYGQYWCLDAFRQQSGLCFYVLYFLDCLFEQLGIVFDNSELLAVEDLKRLCFFTTQCKFDLRKIQNADFPNGKRLNNYNEIKDWLRSHCCNGWGELKFAVATTGLTKEFEGTSIHVNDQPTDKNWGFGTDGNWSYHTNVFRTINGTISCASEVYEMYANSLNFPDAAVSSVIKSLENSFGIRFLYDPEKRIVTARLLRNIYKDIQTREFKGEVISMVPLSQKITGVRMQYAAESEDKEQRANVRKGVKDYDTDYDYIDFPPQRTEENPTGRTITDLTYQQIVRLVTSTNNNVYVDQTTGNVYRVKLSSEAEDAVSLRPVLFQVGQFKGIEEGDCSEKNSDYVREFISEFIPLGQSIINAQDYNANTDGTVSPVYAPMLDVEMEHEYLPQKVQSVIHHDLVPAAWAGDSFKGGLQFLSVQQMTLSESYDPTQTDTGNSPLQEIDWGLTVAIMRGAGSDAEIVNYDRGYDGFDNSKWKDTIAIYETYSDTMDQKGAVFDYNGSESGIGTGERLSLQIRSWVKPSWADAPLCAEDEYEGGVLVNKIRSRGLYDSCLREHSHFLLNRKPYKARVHTTIAQLIDIRNHWTDFYLIGGKIGLINKISYNISRRDGVKEAVIEFYSF